MVYRFLILSDEVDDFRREIQISSEATFLDFHRAILAATGYKDDQMCSFFICSDDWSKETEITLVDMGATSSEVDSYVMEDTVLEELIDEELQRLLYTFDYMMERSLFIELKEIITGKTLDKAVCTESVGEPPVQEMSVEELEKRVESVSVDEDFYGDSEYDDEELEGLGFGDESIDSLYDDERF
jgi:hypothetical protein